MFPLSSLSVGAVRTTDFGSSYLKARGGTELTLNPPGQAE